MSSYSRDAGSRPLPLLAKVGAGLLLLAVGAVAASAQTYVPNPNQVPLWNQHQDFRPWYVGVDSSIPVNQATLPNGPWISYNNLPGTATLNLQGPVYQRNGAGNAFAAGDYYGAGADMAGGGWHCAPASAAMWVEWLRANVLTQLADRGGQFNSIRDFAYDADTNQRKNQATNGIGLLGTFRGNMVDATDAYVNQTYTGLFRPRIRAWNYTQNAYTQMIDRGKPPVVFYQNAGGNSGHVVVGVGYNGGNALLRDPWNATERAHAMNTIQQLGGGGGGVLYGDEPQSADFNADWAGTRLHTMEVPHTGNAPSLYYFNKPTAHVSQLREWLGPTVAPDSDPFFALPQSNADGVKLLNWTPGGLSTIAVTVSSRSGISVDGLFEQDLPPTLYLNGWVDWNQDNTWDPTEQVVAWSGAADFDGSQTYFFDINTPQDATGVYWSHFRLDRGEDVGAYGLAQYGEVEDYQFGASQVAAAPEPAALALWLLPAILGFGVCYRSPRAGRRRF